MLKRDETRGYEFMSRNRWGISEHLLRIGQRQGETSKYTMRIGQGWWEMNITRIMDHGLCTAKTCKNGWGGWPKPDSNCFFLSKWKRNKLVHSQGLGVVWYKESWASRADIMGADAVDFFLKRTRKERAYSLTRSGCRLIQRVEERYYGRACYSFF